jgi:hypothetical protein
MYFYCRSLPFISGNKVLFINFCIVREICNPVLRHFQRNRYCGEITPLCRMHTATCVFCGPKTCLLLLLTMYFLHQVNGNVSPHVSFLIEWILTKFGVGNVHSSFAGRYNVNLHLLIHFKCNFTRTLHQSYYVKYDCYKENEYVTKKKSKIFIWNVF